MFCNVKEQRKEKKNNAMTRKTKQKLWSPKPLQTWY
jgi:hypothetical protein